MNMLDKVNMDRRDEYNERVLKYIQNKYEGVSYYYWPNQDNRLDVNLKFKPDKYHYLTVSFRGKEHAARRLSALDREGHSSTSFKHAVWTKLGERA